MINYLKGDATEPSHKPTLICHIVNDIGKFGSGFAAAIAKKWPHVQKAYFDWAATIKLGGDFYLGQIQIVKAEQGIAVCNMLAQRSVGMFHHISPCRLDALYECLYRVNLWLNLCQDSIDDTIRVSMPKIGCGLGGQQWKNIEPIINENLVYSGHIVDVYEIL